MSEKLELAEKRMAEIQARISSSEEQKKLLPRFHFSSPCGWINDPNGFCFFGGEFHLFAQWHPFSTRWGPMHWCHASSKNLVKWKTLPPAIAPDSEADSEGCFSGSAVEHCGKLFIAYTGVSKKSDSTIQNQCVAFFDGKKFTKPNFNPILTASEIPFEYETEHFRDPKIWRDGEKFFLAAVLKKKDGRGALVVFESADFEKWNFLGIADEEKTSQSTMWECPDIFSLGGKRVFILSPQEMQAEKKGGFNKGNNTVYLLGEFKKDECKFVRENPDFTMLDLGMDFYAAQTMQDFSGRRIMIAWMQNWDSCNTPKNYLWSGMMTFPRELKIENGKLIQTPVREIENFYGKEIAGKITGEKIFSLRHCALKLKIIPKSGSREILNVKIGGKKQFALFEFDGEKMELAFNRENTIEGGGAMNKKSICVALDEKGELNLLCLIDTSSLEIFINGGEKVFTNNFFISSEENSLAISSTFFNAVEFSLNEIL